MRNRTRKMNKLEKEFLKFVRSECKKYGVKCVLRSSEYLKLGAGMTCSGYFDESVPIIMVAKDRSDWLEILVHEYCHLTQWVDNCKEWRRMDKNQSCWKVDDWLEGKYIKNPWFHLKVMRDLELDNEKRAVRTIKKFGLDRIINLDKYIQKANAYVNFYNYMKYTRRWTSNHQNTPYKNPVLINAMPKNFRMNYNKMSKKVYDAFVKSGI